VLGRLPASMRARIMTALLLEPPTKDAPQLVRRLMQAGGAVALKVGQQLSEDPNVPKRFRDALEDSRDSNEAMSMLAFWSQIPRSERPKIRAIGTTLGVGSVKQVAFAEIEPAFLPRGADPKADIVAAVIREGAAEDIREGTLALEALPHVRHLARRVKPMLERELALEREAIAFTELLRCPIGRLKSVRVPEVISAKGGFLLRFGTGGETVARITRRRALTPAEKSNIERLHERLIRAALDVSPRWRRENDAKEGEETFVLTDPHDANVSLCLDDLGLFDPGQFEKLTPREASFFVRLLAAFGGESSMRARRDAMIAELATFATPGEPNATADTVTAGLSRAYDEVLALKGATPESRMKHLFQAANKNDVAIPNSYFGLAKMLDTLSSRERTFGLRPITRRTIAGLYLAQRGGWGRLAKPFVSFVTG
jgi:hypothetical protein